MYDMRRRHREDISSIRAVAGLDVDAIEILEKREPNSGEILVEQGSIESRYPRFPCGGEGHVQRSVAAGCIILTQLALIQIGKYELASRRGTRRDAAQRGEIRLTGQILGDA
jgi:hypothetical protein